jgi:hypothetical protein
MSDQSSLTSHCNWSKLTQQRPTTLLKHSERGRRKTRLKILSFIKAARKTAQNVPQHGTLGQMQHYSPVKQYF